MATATVKKNGQKAKPAAKISHNNNKKSTAKSNGKAADQKPVNYRTDVDDNSMLGKLFLDSLKDIYWAEKHLTKALPKMKKAATSPDLAEAFEEHLAITKEHVSRLEQVFELLGKKAQAKKCDAMEGLAKEADEVIEETEKGTMTRDVALIMAAQKVEHYEIATYGSLATLAAIMGNEEIKNLLGQTLDEEKDADESLTKLAEGHINRAALQED